MGQTTIDWAKLESLLQPATIDQADWDNIWAQFVAQAGDTPEQLGQLLGQLSNALSSLGRPTPEASGLIEFGLLLSAGVFPRTQVTGALDLGLSDGDLALGRAYDGSLLTRNHAGLLGDGWTFTYDITAITDRGGSVSIHTPQGFLFFLHKPDGTFVGAPGSGTLIDQGGAYLLMGVDGSVVHFRADGRFSDVVDTNGNTVTANWSDDGRLTGVSGPHGQSLAFTYTAQGRIARATDAAGHVVDYTYDAAGSHLIAVTTAEGTTRYAYRNAPGTPADNTLVTITRADGTHHTFKYDASGRLSSEYDDGGAGKVSYDYSVPGGVKVADGLGHQTTVLYDSGGNVARVTDAYGHSTDLDHDRAGRLTGIATPGGSTASFTYDDTGNLVGAVDPLGGQLAATYDFHGKLTSLTDQNGHAIGYAYDNAGNLSSVRYEDATRTAYTYNTDGSLRAITNARGQTEKLAYDAKGQLVRTAFADGTGEAFTYDRHGNLTSATARDGQKTAYAYDAADHLTAVTDAQGRTESFHYDAAGRRTERVDPDGTVTKYGYDAAGRLSVLRDGADHLLVSYSYDAAGHVTGVANGNGTRTTYVYGSAGEVTQITNYDATSAVIAKEAYRFDADMRVVKKVTLDGTWGYTYDDAGQLTRAVFASTNAAIANRTLAYAYDAAGNRISSTENGVTTTYTTNKLNQYTASDGTTYTYDKDGNLTGKTGPGGTWTYTYDQENQLTAVKGPGNETWVYAYDALGNRISSTHNGTKESYVIDPTGLATVAQTYGAGGNVAATYVYGLGLAADLGAAGSADDAFYQFDVTGNVTGQTGAAGTTTDRWFYDPFGDTSHVTGSSDNPFLYSGAYGIASDGSGLAHMRARYYDSEFGRFVSRDPIGIAGGINLYTYANNSPINSVDPTGLAQHYVHNGDGYGAAVVIGAGVALILGGTAIAFVGFGYAAGAAFGIGLGLFLGPSITQGASQPPGPFPPQGGGQPGGGPSFTNKHPGVPTSADPLVFDLSGNGLVLRSVTESNAHFDYSGSGFAVKTGWSQSNEGILVLKNPDGSSAVTADTMLGARSGNGVADLKALDANSDGKVDASDAAFANLRMWIDGNGDGVSTATELRTLSSLGITQIDTGTAAASDTLKGNTVVERGTFRMASGTVRKFSEVLFAVDPIRTVVQTPADFVFDSKALLLPQLVGYGGVTDLAVAMTRTPSLLSAVKQLVLDFKTLSDTQFDLRFDQVLNAWTGASGWPPTRRARMSMLATCMSWTSSTASIRLSRVHSQHLQMLFWEKFSKISTATS